MTEETKQMIAAKAAEIIFQNEGNYGSVNADDNGAVSIGKMQWHGSRALDLLKAVISGLGQTRATTILGSALFEEIKTAIEWSRRTVDAAEKKKLTVILTTPEGRAAQDDQAEKDVLAYVHHGARLGMIDKQALAYFADIENQGGCVVSERIAKAAMRAGKMSQVTLTMLHCAAMNDAVIGAYKARREKAYKLAAASFTTPETRKEGIRMGVMLSNCGHDENGKYSGGQPGDQTGTEWQIIPWYNRPWDCVLRHPDAAVRQLIADLATKAANNNNIGYNQAKRYTFGTELQKAGNDPAKIKTKCDTDCSAGVIDIVKAVGRIRGRQELAAVNATYTGNMKNGFSAAGFQVLTDKRYLTSGDYLIAGDIVLNEQHHVATVISTGNGAGSAAPAQQSAGATTVHTVKEGDTLTDIAAAYNVDWQEIARINKITNPNVIVVGQRIEIPVATHTVRAGDTLYSLAQKYLGDGMRYKEIEKLNHLEGKVYHPGDVLQIPRK